MTLSILLNYGGIAFATDDFCSKLDIKSISRHISIPPSTIASCTKINDKDMLYQVILKDIRRIDFIPLIIGNDFVIKGQVYKNRVITTQKTREDLIKKEVKKFLPQLDFVSTIKYVPEKYTGNHLIYFITDPLCPYCNEAGEDLKIFAENNNVMIKLILYSVHPDEGGDEKSVQASCMDFTLDEYLSRKWKKEPAPDESQCRLGIENYNNAGEVYNELGIDGVPAFILEDGTLVSGAGIELIEKAFKGVTEKGSNLSLRQESENR